jgi:hypothetical protein
MCFEWLIEEPYQRNYWPARRIKCSEDGSKSVISPIDLAAPIRSEPTAIDYVNFEPTVPNPSAILLDAHNRIASLYQQLTPYRRQGRQAFPVHPNSLWKSFIRPETCPDNRNSRQLQRRSDRTFSSGTGPLDYPSQRSQQDRMNSDRCSDGANNFQQAIEEYLGRQRPSWIDQLYHGDGPQEEGELNDDEYLRCNAFIPAWRDGIIP